MEGLRASFGLQVQRLGAGHHARRDLERQNIFANHVFQPLQGEFILRIEMDRRAKFRQRFHLLAVDQVLVATLNVFADAFLPRQLFRCFIVHIVRHKLVGFLESIESILGSVFTLKLKALVKSALRPFTVLLGDRHGGSIHRRRGSCTIGIATRTRRCRYWLLSQSKN